MRKIPGRTPYLVVCAALAIAFSGADRVDAAEHPTMDALVEEPLAVVRVDSLVGAAQALADTRIGQHVKASPVLSGLAEVGHGSWKTLAALLTDFSQPTLERLLSREAALVIFEWDGIAQEPPVALVLHLGGDADLVRQAFEEQFVPRAMSLDPRLEVDTATVSGSDYMVRVTNAGKESYVRFTDGLLVMGPKSVVRKFRAGGTAPAWLADRTAETGLAFVSVNLTPAWDVAMQVGDRKGLQATGLPAMTDLQVSTGVVDGGFKDTAVASLSGTPAGVLAALTSLQPGPTGCAAVVPDDYSLLASVQTESGEKLLGLIEDSVLNIGGDQALQQFRAGMDQIDQAFTVNVEWELLPGIGHEAFLAMRTPDLDMLASGRAPVWADFEPIFGFAVKDRVILTDLIKRFARSPMAMQQGWRLITTGHGDYEVYALENMAFNFHLALAFANDYCILSTDRGHVIGALDAVDGGKVMAADARYRASRAHVPEQVNAYVYLDTHPVREAVLALLPGRLPPKARAWAGVLAKAVPDLGSYSLAVSAEGPTIRAEGYGELPLAFTGLGLLGISGAVGTQKAKARLPGGGA